MRKAVLSRLPILLVHHPSEQKLHHCAAALGIETHRELVPRQHPQALYSSHTSCVQTSHSLVHIDAADFRRRFVAAEVIGGVKLVSAHPAVVTVDHEGGLSDDLSGQGIEVHDRVPIDVQCSERTRPLQTLDIEIDARKDRPRPAIVRQLPGEFFSERLTALRQAHKNVIRSLESDVWPRGIEFVDECSQERLVEIGIHFADHGQRIDRNDVESRSVFRCGSLNHALDKIVEPTAVRRLLFACGSSRIDCLWQLDQTIGRVGRCVLWSIQDRHVVLVHDVFRRAPSGVAAVPRSVPKSRAPVQDAVLVSDDADFEIRMPVVSVGDGAAVRELPPRQKEKE